MKSRPLVAGVSKPVSQMVLGTSWYSLKNRDPLFDILDGFAASGGTTLDTARCYGESEDVIGLWMEARSNRDKVLLITKGGLSEKDPTTLAAEGLREKVDKDITRSLECLRTDHIDLYFLHRDAPTLPVGEIVERLNAEKARGRIRAFGGSNWQTSRVDEANEYADKHGMTRFAAVSNNLSLAVPTGPFYPGLVWTDAPARRWHASTGIPLFSWASLARGFFTGRFRPADKPKDSFAAGMIRVYDTDENIVRLRRAEELGKAKGHFTAIQVALAWVLHQPFTVLPLVGLHSNEELASSLAALSIQLSEAEVKWLNLDM
jgi:aryl-alcohol dehydrogenase-like predicted oxidoreductase